MTVNPCWKIFSTFFTNSGYYQRAISDGSTIVDGANNRPCCESGCPVLTWAVDGTTWTIVPPVGFPTRESEIVDLVEVARFPGTASEQTECNYGKTFRRIRPVVCFCRFSAGESAPFPPKRLTDRWSWEYTNDFRT